MSVTSSINSVANESFTAGAAVTAGNSATTKVMADIAFLRDRIAQMNSHRNPNPAVLQTYTTMLARRELALSLLQNEAQTEQ